MPSIRDDIHVGARTGRSHRSVGSRHLVARHPRAGADRPDGHARRPTCAAGPPRPAARALRRAGHLRDDPLPRRQLLARGQRPRRRREPRRRSTPSTSFAIASVSKTFTAALVLALAEDGLIELDDPVRELPAGPTRSDARITVRQLLDHTSGLRDYFFHPAIDQLLLARPRPSLEPGQDLAEVRRQAVLQAGRAAGTTRTRTTSSSAARRARRARRRSGDQIRTRFLEPLGLRHTWYQPTESAHGRRRPRATASRRPRRTPRAIDLSDGTPFVPFTSVVTAAGGAGGLASNASDLARWARALYAGGVLEPESVDAMLDDIA